MRFANFSVGGGSFVSHLDNGNIRSKPYVLGLLLMLPLIACFILLIDAMSNLSINDFPFIALSSVTHYDDSDESIPPIGFDDKTEKFDIEDNECEKLFNKALKNYASFGQNPTNTILGFNFCTWVIDEREQRNVSKHLCLSRFLS